MLHPSLKILLNLRRLLMGRPSALLLFGGVRRWLAWMLLAAVSATAAEKGELTFCYENENIRPWQYRDGTGLNFELLDRVAARLGLHFRYQAAPWKRCLLDLKGNMVSGVLDASFKTERRENGTYPQHPANPAAADPSRALHIERYVVVRRQGGTADWNGKTFERLVNPAGAPLGYSVVDDLKQAGITVDDGAPTTFDVLQKLLRGRIDVAILLQGEVAALLADDPALTGKVEVLPRPYAEKPYYLMLSHRLAREDPELARRIWSAIAMERAAPDWQARERRALTGSSTR